MFRENTFVIIPDQQIISALKEQLAVATLREIRKVILVYHPFVQNPGLRPSCNLYPLDMTFWEPLFKDLSDLGINIDAAAAPVQQMEVQGLATLMGYSNTWEALDDIGNQMAKFIAEHLRCLASVLEDKTSVKMLESPVSYDSGVTIVLYDKVYRLLKDVFPCLDPPFD